MSKSKATEEDDYEEETFDDSQNVVDEVADLESQKVKEREVTSLLSRNQNAEALRVALSNPPLSKSAEAKKIASDAVIRALVQTKEADIEKTVSGVTGEDLTLLMKFIYKGLAQAQNSGHLLKWHATVTEKGGLGTIMRVLTDRNTV